MGDLTNDRRLRDLDFLGTSFPADISLAIDSSLFDEVKRTDIPSFRALIIDGDYNTIPLTTQEEPSARSGTAVLYFDGAIVRLKMPDGTVVSVLPAEEALQAAQAAQASADASVKKAGDTMTGTLTVPNGTLSGHAVNKGQLDAEAALRLAQDAVEAAARAAADSTEAAARVAADALLLPLTGGTLTGDLKIPTAPAASNSAITRAYFDAIFAPSTGIFVDFDKNGGVGNGTTDDSTALQSLADTLYGLGGGEIRLSPNKTYLLGTPQGTFGILHRPRSNVHIVGAGDTSVLKVKGGLSINPIDVIRLLQDDPLITKLQNCSFRWFKIDFNGLNNLVPSSRSFVGIGARFSSDILIMGVTFFSNPGHQCILFGTTGATIDNQNTRVIACTFHNVGSAVTGNTLSTDHSSIYITGQRAVVSNNLFINDAVGNREQTAIEMHTQYGSVFGNVVLNYGRMFNICAQVQIFGDMVYSSNVGFGLRSFIGTFTSAAFALRDTLFIGNIAHFDVNDQYHIDIGSASAMQSSVPVTGVRLEYNRFFCHAGVLVTSSGLMLLGLCRKIAFNHNHVEGSAGRVVTTLTPNTGDLDLETNYNNIIDCGQNTTGSAHEAFGINTSNVTYKRWQCNGNRIFNSTAGRIAFGGAFHAGDVITLTVGGSVTIPYTVSANDINLQGVVQSLAAWLNMDPVFAGVYVAEARNLDLVICTVASGVTTTLTASVTGAGATITATVASITFVTYMTGAFASVSAINDAEFLWNDVEGVSRHFNLSNANVAAFIMHRGVGSPKSITAGLQGSRWIDRNAIQGDTWDKLTSLGLNIGWLMRRGILSLPTTGLLTQGDRLILMAPSASSIAEYVCTTGGGRKSATWANALAVLVGQWVLGPTSTKIYRACAAGTAATGSEPTHSSGTVTGADGIPWTFMATVAAVVAPIATGAGV
jgi:type II secretory pathway pseudopilin PulG